MGPKLAKVDFLPKTAICINHFSLHIHNRLAMEWQGKKDVFKPVHIALCPTKCLLILRTDKGQPLQMVNMDRLVEIPVWLSNNKQENLLLLHFPKDCDLVRPFIKYLSKLILPCNQLINCFAI